MVVKASIAGISALFQVLATPQRIGKPIPALFYFIVSKRVQICLPRLEPNVFIRISRFALSVKVYLVTAELLVDATLVPERHDILEQMPAVIPCVLLPFQI